MFDTMTTPRPEAVENVPIFSLNEAFKVTRLAEESQGLVT